MDENQKNKQICDLLRQYYPQYKVAALYLDEFTGTTSLLSLNEIRNAIDHLARAAQVTEEADEEYVQSQIDKAKGHFARAVYDSCDSVLMEASSRLKKIPKYSAIDLQQLNDILAKIDRCRIYRQNFVSGEIDSDYITTVHEIMSEVKKFEAKIIEKKPHFFASRSFWNLIIPVLLGVLLSVFAQWIFTHFFSK